MNIAESFARYMEDSLSLGTYGIDIKVGGVGLGDPSSCWWVVLAGGTPGTVNDTGELQKRYTLEVYYRNMDQKIVYDQMNTLETEINKGHCTQLTDFDTIDMKATLFPSDQDIDNQERTVGLLQVIITTYYKE